MTKTRVAGNLGTYDALTVLQALGARDERERLLLADGLQNLVHLGLGNTLPGREQAPSKSAAAPNSKSLSSPAPQQQQTRHKGKASNARARGGTLIVLRFFLTVMAMLSIVQKPASCQGSAGQGVQAESGAAGMSTHGGGRVAGQAHALNLLTSVLVMPCLQMASRSYA